jgi:hypothetical protein
VPDPQKYRTHILAVLQALKAEEARRASELQGVAPDPDAAATMTALVAALSRLEPPADVVAGTAGDPRRLAGLCVAARVLKAGLAQVCDLLAHGALMTRGDRARVVRPCPPEVIAGLLGFGPRDPRFQGSARTR